MVIQTPDTSRTVTDYDFSFNHGHFLAITIDPKYGDVVEEDGETSFKLRMGARPSTANPAETLPEEKLTIMKRNLAFVACRTRTITDKTPEEKAEWSRFLAEVGSKSTIQ